MSALGHALAEGRLTMVEYDERLTEVCEANTRGELTHLFRDIPHSPAVGNSTEVAVYSANEIAETRRRGQNMRAGLMGLSTIGAFGGMGLALAAGAELGAVLLLLIIPTVFILLYIMKVGPNSWYTPSPRQLERQRLREIQAARAEETALRRADRRQQIDQLTGDAVGLAQSALNRLKNTKKK